MYFLSYVELISRLIIHAVYKILESAKIGYMDLSLTTAWLK